MTQGKTLLQSTISTVHLLTKYTTILYLFLKLQIYISSKLYNNWKWTTTEIQVINGTYRVTRPICYHTHIFSVMKTHTTWYSWIGYSWILPCAHLLGNETSVRYGKIQDCFTRVISYEYMLMYRTVEDTLLLLWPTHAKYVSTIFYDSTHALKLSYNASKWCINTSGYHR